MATARKKGVQAERAKSCPDRDSTTYARSGSASASASATAGRRRGGAGTRKRAVTRAAYRM
jgi:hypothetical protein